MYIYKTLSNGIRVVAEEIPYLKSVSIGVWIGNGSRYEKKEENGISHFIEHMLFKGTKNREAWQIAGEIDAVGGQLNAFTAREYTCFYTKTLDEHAPVAMDILSDMIFNSLLDDEHMNLERSVIVEEINMYEDSPEDLVYDLFSYAAWGDTPMGRTILGTKESLDGINSGVMRAYMDSHYRADNIIISVSGNFCENFFELLEQNFGKYRLNKGKPDMPEGIYTPHNIIRKKDTEQLQLVVGFNGIDIMDESVYSLLVFYNVFGCGMSSRLFQNIREKYGLVYSICEEHSAYINTGTFDIAAGMSVENAKRVAMLISEEVNRVKREKLSYDEVARAKEMLKGSYILSYESIGARMQAAGRNLLLNRPIISSDEVIDKINKISKDSIADIIDTVLDTKTLSLAAVGPIDSIDNLFDF